MQPPAAAPNHNPLSRDCGRLSLVALVLLTSSLVACFRGDDDRPGPEVARPPTPAPSPTATVSSGEVPCPVSSDICQLARTFLPVIRTGDAQRLVRQATPQPLTCPNGGPAASEFAVMTVCAGHEAGTTVSVYELNNGKAPRYFSGREGFADAVSEALRQSEPLEAGIGAVGCGVSSTTPGEALSCDTSSIVMYELWDQDVYLALVFTRAHPSADWMIEKYWNIFPSAVPNPITNGARIAAYTVTGADAFEIYSYEPAAAPTDTVTPRPLLTPDAVLAALAGSGYPAIRGGNNLGCAPTRGQADPISGQDYRVGDASFHLWVYPSAADLLARWDVAPDHAARPKPTSGCPALPATYANQNIVIVFERPDPPQAALDAVLNVR